MRKGPVLALLLGLVLPLVPSHPTAAVPRPQEAAPPVFSAESSVVLLDIVVRDKKGRLIKDLKESEFEVFEDGQKQTVSSFQVFDRMQEGVRVPEATDSSAPPSAPKATAAAVVEAEDKRAPVVIAFVFDRMSTEGLANAQKAAKAYTTRGHVEGDLVGVFTLDLALRTLQPFTKDVEAVRDALGKVTLRAASPYAERREETRTLAAQVDRADQILGTANVSGTQQGAGGNAFIGEVSVQRTFDNMQARILNSFDRLERDQQGFASTNGLAAMVSGLKALPGRKTLVFFSEGLAIPANVLAQFRGVVAAANRANVTVYAIDAGGLRVASELTESRAELVATSKRRVDQESRGGVGGTDGPMMVGIEQVEDRLRSSPKAGLGTLAEETGGFLVADTNDASKGFARIQEEMRFYYVLSYSPTDARFDGRFRNLSVKVSRSGAVVYSRKGYFAIPPDATLPVRPVEAPVLAELGRKPAPSELPLSALALSFPEIERPGRVPVMMHMPLAGVQFDLDKQKKTYQASFTMLARFLDSKGQEVDRMSREYPVSVPETSLEMAKKGDVFFFQETDLLPGAYTLEAVVLDTQSKKASVKRTPFVIPPVSEGKLRLSSVVLLRRVEKLGAEEIGRDNPLYHGDTILYPNMGEAVMKSQSPTLGFYFTAYVPKGLAAPKQAQVEIIKGGTSLARLPVALGAPNEAGRIQHAARLPVQALDAGEYSLRVSVTSGNVTATQQTPFVVAN
jgi:VWFA-related protein